MLSIEDPKCRHEHCNPRRFPRTVPLVDVGEQLSGAISMSVFLREEISLIEADAQGRRTRAEVFAPNRLADAVARLYDAIELAARPPRAHPRRGGARSFGRDARSHRHRSLRHGVRARASSSSTTGV